ncbi:substance-P receptor-like [Saccoglossus kowalevskii]|uniref:B1 bradykinin receptor-like n=1 Tax=Saccoglossus kowalevskii TaxID=10224 RepID=A0ABM0LYH1_SACKO|nr:PREDICTED: B1 bradykinin receptor-like [Saccoglossus kowalevskii]
MVFRWNYGPVLCHLLPYLSKSATLVSIYTLIFIAFDRYTAVMSPVASTVSRQRRITVVIVIWIASLLFSLPLAYFKKYENVVNGGVTVPAVNSLTSIVILFGICWLPARIFTLVATRWYSDPVVIMTIKCCIFIWLILSDCVFNPVVYVLLSDKFKAEARRVCRCCFDLNERYPPSAATRTTAIISHTNTRNTIFNN